MHICTFAGHSFVFSATVEVRLRNEIEAYLIPQELIGVHPKAAIQKRNRWMCDQAELLIAFVCRDYGGAHETLNYAMRKGNIRIINLAE